LFHPTELFFFLASLPRFPFFGHFYCPNDFFMRTPTPREPPSLPLIHAICFKDYEGTSRSCIPSDPHPQKWRTASLYDPFMKVFPLLVSFFPPRSRTVFRHLSLVTERRRAVPVSICVPFFFFFMEATLPSYFSQAVLMHTSPSRPSIVLPLQGLTLSGLFLEILPLFPPFPRSPPSPRLAQLQIAIFPISLSGLEGSPPQTERLPFPPAGRFFPWFQFSQPSPIGFSLVYEPPFCSVPPRSLSLELITKPRS